MLCRIFLNELLCVLFRLPPRNFLIFSDIGDVGFCRSIPQAQSMRCFVLSRFGVVVDPARLVGSTPDYGQRHQAKETKPVMSKSFRERLHNFSLY